MGVKKVRTVRPEAGHRIWTPGLGRDSKFTCQKVLGRRKRERGHKEKKHQKESGPFSYSSFYSPTLATWSQRVTLLSTQPLQGSSWVPPSMEGYLLVPEALYNKEIPMNHHTLLSSSSSSDKPSSSPASRI